MRAFSPLRNFYRSLQKIRKMKYIEGLKKNGMQIGQDVDFIGDFFPDPSHCFLVSIGDHCTICPNVRFIAHDASTNRCLGFTKIGRIEIGHDCFIGDSAIILPNVRIGPNSIIGAGAVVTRDVPADTVAAGNPARILGTREEYLARISRMKKGRKIFGKDYWIDSADQRRKQEIFDAVQHGIGFIL